MDRETPIDTRRRRARYRATYRGTKEMDWLLGRFAAAQVAAMAEGDLAVFERLLALPDPELHHWITVDPAPADPAFAAMLARIRAFHGIDQGVTP